MYATVARSLLAIGATSQTSAANACDGRHETRYRHGESLVCPAAALFLLLLLLLRNLLIDLDICRRQMIGRGYARDRPSRTVLRQAAHHVLTLCAGGWLRVWLSGLGLEIDRPQKELGLRREPWVSNHVLEQGSFGWIRDKDPAQQISCQWCDVLGERERRAHNVLVQQVDVVAFGVGRIVVVRKIACQHGVQYDATAPDVHLASAVPALAHDELRRGVARAAATRLHQVAAQPPTGSVHQLAQAVVVVCGRCRVKDVCEAKVGYDDVAVAVKKQVLELQVTMDDALVVEILDSRYQLRKESARNVVLEITVCQNVVKELTAARVLEDDADVLWVIGDDLETSDYIWMVAALQHADLSLHLVEFAFRRDALSSDELDGDLGVGVGRNTTAAAASPRVALDGPTKLDLAKFSCTESQSSSPVRARCQEEISPSPSV